MPRAKPKKPVAAESTDLEPTARDYVMARLAAGRAAAQSAVNAIDEALNLFVNPDEDDDGGERTEMIDEALEALGVASRATEAAEKGMSELENDDIEAGEPWDEEDGDEDEGD